MGYSDVTFRQVTSFEETSLTSLGEIMLVYFTHRIDSTSFTDNVSTPEANWCLAVRWSYTAMPMRAWKWHEISEDMHQLANYFRYQFATIVKLPLPYNIPLLQACITVVFANKPHCATICLRIRFCFIRRNGTTLMRSPPTQNIV